MLGEHQRLYQNAAHDCLPIAKETPYQKNSTTEGISLQNGEMLELFLSFVFHKPLLGPYLSLINSSSIPFGRDSSIHHHLDMKATFMPLRSNTSRPPFIFGLHICPRIPDEVFYGCVIVHSRGTYIVFYQSCHTPI